MTDNKQKVRLTINGAEHTVEGDSISYEDIVELAGLTGEPSMTYKGPDGEGRTVQPGETVQVGAGAVINAHHTGNA